MSRTTVYRTVGRVRRTSIPRSSGAAAGLTMGFGRMLAKLSQARESLEQSRPKRRS